MKKITINAEEELSVPDEVFEELKQKYGKKSPVFNMYDGYYYLDSEGDVTIDIWQDSLYDRYHLEIGNAFKTEEEAEAHAEWLKAVAIIKRSSDFVPDWGCFNSDKYFVFYDNDSKEFYTDCSWRRHSSILAYYPNKEAVEKALADPKIKHAYEVVFGVAK